MKTIEIKKHQMVNIPREYQFDNIVAVQLVEFKINFFGHIETFILDTRIDKSGKQTVIDGNGWIESGYQII